MVLKIIIIKNQKKLFKKAAKLIKEISEKSIKKNKIFTAALSGGKTPVELFKLLSIKYKNKIEWSKVHLFQTDERCVPFNDGNRNYKTIHENLIKPLDIQINNIHVMQKNLTDAKKAAGNYEKKIKTFFKTDIPEFDLILLGIGEDGHTASLFPDDKKALTIKNKIIINTVSKKMQPKVKRITFTLNAINNAKNIIFLITGENKKKVINEIINNKKNNYPASLVRPKERLYFFYDNEINK